MSRFYGWTPEYILSMEASEFKTFVECARIIEARETLMNLNIGDYPHAKDNSRRKFHKEISSDAFPDLDDQKKKPLSTEEVAKLIGGRVKSGR